MKVFKAKCGDETIKTVFTQGEHRVSVGDIVPNDWNPNKVDPQMLTKLEFVINETLEDTGRIPPIVCRPHTKDKTKLEIIDGEHRWKIVKKLGYGEIDVVVLYVSKVRAMAMTSELNYNRGEPDMEKYPAYLARMLKEFDGIDVKYLAERLPDTEDEIRSYLEAADFEVDEVKIDLDNDDDDDDSSETKDASNTDALLELKFTVRQGGAEVIEREIARLTKALGGGKNLRGRALEAMAVLSSQTPSGSLDVGDDSDTSESQPKPKKKKKKKRDDNVRVGHA